MIHLGDCLDILGTMEPASVDLVFGSPPYVNCRTYGIAFDLRGQDWVDWMVARMVAMLRVSRGLVAMVVEGKTSKFRYDCTPALLMADLHRRGVHLRKPPAFYRVGIPGSGGPDWLRNDWEWIVCCTNGGKLPWSDNTAMGHPPKWAPGGAMSNRLSSGSRVNQFGSTGGGVSTRNADGSMTGKVTRPSHYNANAKPERDDFGFTPHDGEPSPAERANGKRRKAPKVAAMEAGEIQGKLHAKSNGDEMQAQAYSVPVLANPGNVIECIVGGGVMGSKLCHENEAPFPEDLAEFFIRSFCPPDGTVLDPFCGSGTTLAVAEKWGRKFIGIDVRQSQVELSTRRVAEAKRPLFPSGA